MPINDQYYNKKLIQNNLAIKIYHRNVSAINLHIDLQLKLLQLIILKKKPTHFLISSTKTTL